jgi:hypothetical protein
MEQVVKRSDPESRLRERLHGKSQARRFVTMTRRILVGSWVEVRSKEEILKTLDVDGRLEGMPFMPEMFQYCGMRFRVHKRAHKTCDYTTTYPYRTRRLERTVHLETRCDGSGHDGCQAGCLLYWKEAWLKSVDRQSPSAETGKGCTEEMVRAHTGFSNPDGTTRYLCQATEIRDATTPLAWWDVRQYAQDYWSGNVSLWRVVSALTYSTYFQVSEAGVGLGRPMRWLYNTLHWVWRGPRWPRAAGVLPADRPTPSRTLNLEPGEWVRVRSHEEILQTVTSANTNRGMYWDAELVPYCGGTYQVLRRVDKLIDEKTGQMLTMKAPCVVLDSVTCQARYSDCRLLCPKSMYPFWREIWLERVNGANPSGR